jgi:exo-beta-1,3-glucanase (GH17 family)
MQMHFLKHILKLYIEMNYFTKAFFLIIIGIIVLGFTESNQKRKGIDITAAEILGNPKYQAIAYSGYRLVKKDSVPTVKEMIEDLKLLDAMGIKLLRTYDTQGTKHAANLLEAIKQLKDKNSNFEMYVMLGVWIDCLDARTKSLNHDLEDVKQNTAEINKAVEMVNKYPDIIKVISVGNEAMIHWAGEYFVRPNVILKWVNYLQDMKKTNGIPANTWITSSDNFESWGGGDAVYKTDDLAKLVKAVDFVSMHTYPFHATYYGRNLWESPESDLNLPKVDQIEKGMNRAMKIATDQFQTTSAYVKSIDPTKTVHIGETGWSTIDNKLFGKKGSRAADEYKDMLFYSKMREWTNKNNISCFYFEAFDEPWKDGHNPDGSENHFGLFTVDGKAKCAIWDLVDKGIFNGLGRNGKPVTKTFNGDMSVLIEQALTPPMVNDFGIGKLKNVNTSRKLGEKVIEDSYVLMHESIQPTGNNKITYPSVQLRLNPWSFTCDANQISENEIEIITGTGDWWGFSLKVAPETKGEDLSNFSSGKLNFEIRGNTKSNFNIGFQTGFYNDGTEVNNYTRFGNKEKYTISENWQKISIPISEIKNDKTDMSKVCAIFTLTGIDNYDGKSIFLKNIYYSK